MNVLDWTVRHAPDAIAFDANEVCIPTDTRVKRIWLDLDLLRFDVPAEGHQALAKDLHKVLAISNRLHGCHAFVEVAAMFTN